MQERRAALQDMKLRGKQEQWLLKTSIATTLGVGALGMLFGFLTGSFSIMFDGVYALMDASMGLLALKVASLITQDALKRDEDQPGRVRYQYGFWHLEPMVLALTSTVLTLISGYALVSAVMIILDGGTDLNFDWALVYTGVVATICFGMAVRQRRRNRRLQSAFVALDAKSWLISGSITLALLIGFAIGWLMEGTSWGWMRPYVDPVVLALVCLVVLPMPFADLREAISEILMVAPPDLDAHVQAVAARAVAQYGFADSYTYVASVGRAILIEIHFLTPPGWPVSSIAELDAIRDAVGVMIGDEGPNRWLTISFTEDADWAF